MSSGRYEAALTFQGWYGFYGAEHHMRVGSIARSFSWIPGEDVPLHRAERMKDDLRLQSESRKTPTHAAMHERCDPWGDRDPASLFKEVGDSAETEYHGDMYVTPKMASRWKEIHWLQIDKRCWEATYGPSTRESAHLREAKYS
jgi:hypothetical protein